MKLPAYLRLAIAAAASVAVVALCLPFLAGSASDATPPEPAVSSVGPLGVSDSAMARAPLSADPRLHSDASLATGAALSASPQTPPTQPSTNAALAQEIRTSAAQVLMREDFSRQQVAVRQVACDGRQCAMQLQFPPFAEASIRQDFKVTSDLFDAFRKQYAEQGVQVALNELSQSDEGMRVSLHLDASPPQSRMMTNEDLAKLRAETLAAYMSSQPTNTGKVRTTPGGRYAP